MAPRPATWFSTRRIFVRGLGLVYAVAFLSLWAQVEGLFGARGIVPAAELLERARARSGGADWAALPTLLWWNASDAALQACCAGGTAAALLVLVGLAPRWALFACWCLYLSLVSVGSPFLDFQWDALLLESGLLAIAFAPGGLRPFRGNERPVALVPLWLLRWLLLRLMFLSGALKLLSGDGSWLSGTALSFHYWTQPLPHRLAHFAHHLPPWCRAASVWTMFSIELALPWCALGPRRARELCASGTVLLMVAIAATGNYGFFNLLAALLCVPLVDDRTWRRLPFVRDRSGAPLRAPRLARARSAGSAAFGVLVLGLTCVPFACALGLALEPPRLLARLVERAAPLRSFNAYGLFRVMTTERPEIVIEGSRDGVEWAPYPFRWKPGELTRPPGFAGPHMPRLDWQMWFAALAGPGRVPWWYARLLARLLEGSPAVLELFERDPFGGRPPRFVRSRLCLYRFSSPAERRAGTWWTRTEAGPYTPAVELVDGQLVHARGLRGR